MDVSLCPESLHIPEPETKTYHYGTHRVCTPEETLARIRPVFPIVGLTRLADVTWLDEIGIPVFQAIRPNSKNLTVSQGKGLTAEAARVSAAMEAIEMWHAQSIPWPSERMCLLDLQRTLPYDPYELPLEEHHVLHDALPMDWIPATVLESGEETYLPRDVVQLDFTVRTQWMLPLFRITSNGLASGNTRVEAAVHALYELIERDALARWRQQGHQGGERGNSLATDDPGVLWLLERLEAARVAVKIEDIGGPTEVPCFKVTLWSPSFPSRFCGSGCHLDRGVALCRALTEAAQSRLTAISGARDDVGDRLYRAFDRHESGGFAKTQEYGALVRTTETPVCSYRSEAIDGYAPLGRNGNLQADLGVLLQRIQSLTGQAVLSVDLTRPGIDVSVMRLVAPGLLFQERH